MKRLIENYINGNLDDAKRLAKRFSYWKIRCALVDDYGYSIEKAALTADYLKGADCWKEICALKEQEDPY